jgi:hypothetical protein
VPEQTFSGVEMPSVSINSHLPARHVSAGHREFSEVGFCEFLNASWHVYESHQPHLGYTLLKGEECASRITSK